MVRVIMDFDQLLQNLVGIGEYLKDRAVAVVNRTMTVRNWCFGVFIVEYEQQGEDKAKYGERLIENLSASLSERGVKGVSVTTLKLCRQFYLLYPEIGPTVSDQLVATAGMDNQVFVSKYKLALPTEEELKVFIQKELND
jgi:hypothetical protein